MQESFLLIPYFSEYASRINGNVAGDSVIERNIADNGVYNFLLSDQE